MAEFGYTAPLMSLFIVLIIYFFPVLTTPTSTTNKQTNEKLVGNMTLTKYLAKTRTKKKKKKKIDRIRYLQSPGSDRSRSRPI